MSKTVSSSVAEATQAEPESKTKTYTKWDTFVKAGLYPTRMVCSVLRGHPDDEACKTALIPKAQNIINHIENGHGGGFMFTVRDDVGKKWDGWKELEKAGMELHGLMCEVCDKEFDLTVRNIKMHLRPHQGKFRGAWQAFNHQLKLWILPTPPLAADDSDDETSTTE